MKTSERGICALVAEEGIVPAPYLDGVEVWSFGIGHTAMAGAPIPANMPRGIPRDLDGALRQVFKVFRCDLAKYEAAVNRALKVPVLQHEFDALLSWHYNTGAVATATLTKMVNAGRTADAAEEFMAWKKPSMIIPRRRAEQAMFRSGAYRDKDAPIWQVSSSGKVIWKPLRMLSQKEVLAFLAEAA